MTGDSADRRLRVILVTTRAALRHVTTDPMQRRAIVERGRRLLEALRETGDAPPPEAMERAFEELDEMERG